MFGVFAKSRKYSDLETKVFYLQARIDELLAQNIQQAKTIDALKSDRDSVFKNLADADMALSKAVKIAAQGLST